MRDLARVQIGPAFRDGALDFNGQEAVGGIVVMRYRENPRDVIQRVEAKITSLTSELGGIKIHPVYDRTLLIEETVGTLSEALGQETLVTIAVMVLFLLHVRASIVIAITLPMAVLMSFIAMKVFGVDANIMSLAGIAIAIGTMVDMGIIILENIYGALADWEAQGSPGGAKRRLEADSRSGGRSRAGGGDGGQHNGRQFSAGLLSDRPRPQVVRALAWTKTFALTASLIVAVAVVPMLCRIFLRSSRMPRWAGFAAGLSTVGADRGAVLVCVARPHRKLDLARSRVGDGRGGGDRISGRLVDDAGEDSLDGREPGQSLLALDLRSAAAICAPPQDAHADRSP